MAKMKMITQLMKIILELLLGQCKSLAQLQL